MEATSTAFVGSKDFYKADFVDKRMSYIGNIFLSYEPRYHFVFTNGNFIGYDTNDDNKSNPNIITPIEVNESGVTTEYVYSLDEIFDSNSNAVLYSNKNARRLMLEAKVNGYDARFAIINNDIVNGYTNGWWDIEIPNSNIIVSTGTSIINNDFDYPFKTIIRYKRC